ncbi:LysR family transcriptional regulator [Cupriavidus basilensis]|uniref:LysR family transcriptional regulator n=1 Tax=Cupriavidus basilensis TaxID=68895 RepID=UPI0023E83B73|nr:LysR family transcriptional regulator [Cupriavidus basilensis]MDF3887580.1 LysR family transcriptional regulator [Cupriavidus basilensis]
MQSRLELWQLNYFVAVADELSFRRAAERLSITQPPLTRQIQALEETIGARLFERDRNGVALTPAGSRLLPEARELLASADALLARARQRATRNHGLRLGITTVFDAALFTWLAPALQAQAPEIRLLQKRQISQQSIADLRRGALDAALIGLPSATGELAVEHLFDDPLVVALPAAHRLARRKRISLPELQADPLFWGQRRLNPAYFDHYEAVFRALGYAPPRVPEPADHHVLLGLIADGQGVALVPSSLQAMARAGVVYKALKEQADLRIGVAVVYAAGNPAPALPLLLETLRARYRPAPTASPGRKRPPARR